MSITAEETSSATKVRQRGEIDKKYLWATEDCFCDIDAWETEFAAVRERVGALAEFKGTLGQGAEQLLKVLQARDEAEARLDRVYVYASLLADQDTRVGETQGLKSRARTLAISYNQALSWLDPELTSIPFETLESWMRDSSELSLYAQAFDDLFRRKKYILPPREEELLAMAGEVRATPMTAYNLLSNADLKFPTIKDERGETRELDDSSFYLFMRSTDRRVRKDAFNAIVGAHAGHRNTAAALLNGAVQSHILTVKARGYDSCLAAALHDGNIPQVVYRTLVETIHEHAGLLHRYQDLRQRALKLSDGVHAYDLFAPLIGEEKQTYTYEEAVETTVASLEPLGDDYVAAMKHGFDSRWVDVFPTKGKRSGAYSSGTYLTQPYILLNFHGGFEDMSTLTHEMGHSMHSHLSRKSQPYVYSDYDIFCAEVASICNEILLQGYVLDRTSDKTRKLHLLGEFLEAIRGTVFRQTMFSEFEQRIHEMAEHSEPLTADTLSETYRTIMARYYGPAYIHDELVDSYWVRIPHFYYNFYVYKYATSYCAAANIAARIKAEEPGARDAYLKFLSSGRSAYPVDLLKLAGVDMTTAQPIADAMNHFKNLLDQTETLLSELGMLD